MTQHRRRRKPAPLPEPAVYYDRQDSRYPDRIRISFADGHTEKLTLPNKSGELNAETLTALLCGGVAVTFNGSSYSMPQDADKGRND